MLYNYMYTDMNKPNRNDVHVHIFNSIYCIINQNLTLLDLNYRSSSTHIYRNEQTL